MTRAGHLIRAVAIDLDGTLLNTGKRVSPRNLIAVLACVDAGLVVVIATARPPRSVQSLLPQELLGIGPVVYYNGGLATGKEGRTVMEQCLSASSASLLVAMLLQAAPECLLTFESNDRLYSTRKLADTDLQAFGILPGDAFLPEPLSLLDILSKPITKILASQLLLSEEWRNRLEEHGAVLVTDGGKLLQVMAKGVSKDKGVQAVLEPMGITANQVMCFGDDTNDAALFSWCGHSVAMGNATPALQRLAREVTLSNDEEGVALVLERLLEDESGLQKEALP